MPAAPYEELAQNRRTAPAYRHLSRHHLASSQLAYAKLEKRRQFANAQIGGKASPLPQHLLPIGISHQIRAPFVAASMATPGLTPVTDKDWRWTPSDQHFSLHWPGSRRCLSSATLNGGVCDANRLLNLKVSGADCQQPPENTLQQYADTQGWTGTILGMMTAASMDSLRWAEAEIEGERLAIYLTSGLSNARCAGDLADWQSPATLPPGTINIVCISNMQLSVASMTEMITVLTEAKTHALHKANIRSPLSGELATGTGTDSIAIISGKGAPQRWLGKHTLAGQRSAELLIQCLTDSIARR